VKAVILAGGKGTRLAPHTNILPKPLIPIGDMPILEINLRQLRAYGFTDVVLCIGYLGDLLEAYFGDGSKYDLSITYSREDEPLGTAGPLGIAPGLDQTFFAMNGDLLTTLNFADMLRFHRSHGGPATVGLADKTVNIDLGVIRSTADHVLTEYIEKPSYNYKVSMGVYVFEPNVLPIIRDAGRLDLPDLIRQLVSTGKKPMTFDSRCRWLDMGRIEDYRLAVETFEADRSIYLPAVVSAKVSDEEKLG
jgi:NDP-sugar pyrophosphorylase family protein